MNINNIDRTPQIEQTNKQKLLLLAQKMGQKECRK